MTTNTDGAMPELYEMARRAGLPMSWLDKGVASAWPELEKFAEFVRRAAIEQAAGAVPEGLPWTKERGYHALVQVIYELQNDGSYSDDEGEETAALVDLVLRMEQDDAASPSPLGREAACVSQNAESEPQTILTFITDPQTLEAGSSDHLGGGEGGGVTQWRSIETAPRDGLLILGRAATASDPAISTSGFWAHAYPDGVDEMGHDGGFIDCSYEVFTPGRSFGAESYQTDGFQPTHWKPFPTPPEGNSK